ncbi:MAG: VanZ family protein [Flavobacteriia bacterium]|nr:VanZ family protein [Flavobacteriia bacterium]
MKLIKVFVGIILIVITYYSLRLPSDESLPTNDKVGHFLAYASLSFNLLLLCKNGIQTIYALLFSISYGLFMEFCQGFIPSRDPSLYDMIANSTGVLIGFILMKLIGGKIKLIFIKH